MTKSEKLEYLHYMYDNVSKLDTSTLSYIRDIMFSQTYVNYNENEFNKITNNYNKLYCKKIDIIRVYFRDKRIKCLFE